MSGECDCGASDGGTAARDACLFDRHRRSRMSCLASPRGGTGSDVRMAKTFKVGDHVSWNSEAGRVRGIIRRVHWKDVNYKGHVHRADADDPQYEIRSDKTDHVALHKGRALRLLSH
jgi:hypothetical protein